MKTYCVDTNVLLSDHGALFAFQDNVVVIPLIVLEELDQHKTRQDDVGACARAVNRALDDLRSKGSLHNGVVLDNGGMLRIETLERTSMDGMPIELSERTNDNMIIATARQLISKGHECVILVSKDINVRVKCDAVGIPSQDYRRMRASADGEIYTGVEVATVSDEVTARLYEKGSVDIDSIELKNDYPNQIVVLKNSFNGTSLARVIEKEGEARRLEPIQGFDDVFGLKPRNKEQMFSLELLCDPNIKLVTLSGPAGTGKSLLALAASLDQLTSLGSNPHYDRLIIMRPVQPLGRDIGFLPGSLEEKMAPWIAPIQDNLNFLFGVKKPQQPSKRPTKKGQTEVCEEPYVSLLRESGKIEIEAITFIRGRSIPNSIILVDEAQNLSLHELKTILTRASEGTKIILTGDINQIDNPHLDAQTNAMTYAIERFKESPLAGHVTLLKGERSALATLASKVL